MIKQLHRIKTTIATLTLGALTITTALAQTTYYVDATMTNNAGAGTSWATAKKDVQDAINTSVAGDMIWVKAGIYTPTQDAFASTTPTDDRTKTFNLKDSVAVYGGFSGIETVLTQRNWKQNTTTLSGDIGAANDSTDNSYHVVLSVQNTKFTALDGFTVSNGNANDPSYGWQFISNNYVYKYSGGGVCIQSSVVKLTNLIVKNNNAKIAGGGMLSKYSPLEQTISNCVFIGNTAGTFGGGLGNESSNSTIINCVFTNNSCANNGGAIDNNNSNPTITNVTIYDNHATSMGGGIANCFATSSPIVTNCIIYNNTAGMMDPQIHNEATSYPTITYCIIQGPITFAGIGNTTANPMFMDTTNLKGTDNKWLTADDGLQLMNSTPAKYAGSPSITSPMFDITSKQRGTGAFDIGAYETSCAIPTAFNITGGGTYCIHTSTGLDIGLDSSEINVNYQLQLNSTNVGALITGTGNSILFSKVTTAGTYTVTAIGMCNDTLVMNNMATVVASSPINLTINYSTPDSIECAGNVDTLIVMGNATSYIWNNAFVTDTLITIHNVGDTTSFTVMGTDSLGCTNRANYSFTSIEAILNFYTIVSGIADSLCVTDSTRVLTFAGGNGSWSGTGIVGSTFNPSIAGVGTHTITYVETYTCGTSTIKADVRVDACIVGLNKLTNTKVTISPNPNNGTFSITTPTYGTYTIVNELGQTVHTFATTANASTVNINGLVSGIYVVKNTITAGTVTKIVVTN
ncbi:MAG: T9SS type A sorting domain-containing protein [Bacteroidia bacterium]|nr:T9SS type A sorting domain-containing protein [Bacteroidia bacterium]